MTQPGNTTAGVAMAVEGFSSNQTLAIVGASLMAFVVGGAGGSRGRLMTGGMTELTGGYAH
jgi:hypothetical protein